MHGCAGASALQQHQRGKGKKRKPTKEQLLAQAEAKRARKDAALADPDAKVQLMHRTPVSHRMAQ